MCIPRYTYGLFCVRIEKFWDLYVMSCDWIYDLKVVGLSLDLLGYPLMAHLERLRSMCDYSAYLWSLIICG